MRLRDRLFGTYLVVGLILVGTLGTVLYQTVSLEARNGVEERMEATVRFASSDLERADAPTDTTELDTWVDAIGRAAKARVTVIGPDGRVVGDSEFDGADLRALDNHNTRQEVISARATGEGRSLRYSRSLGADLLYHARRVDGGVWDGSVARVAVPLTRVAAARHDALGGLAFALLLALMLALASAAFWSRRLSAPIRSLADVAGQVMEGDLDARARIDTGDEVEDLGRALNAATIRLAERIAAATAEGERLEALLDGMVEGVVATDQDGRITLANPALREIFGLERPVLGRTVNEALRQPEIAEAMREVAEARRAAMRELRITWPAEKWLALHAAPLAKGGAVGVFHDVTALKRLDAVRRDFVANVSHELQTPLAALAGWAEALADDDGDDEDRYAGIAAIRRQVGRLSALVSDLLDLSRLEAEGATIQPTRVNLTAVLRERAAEWRARMEGRGLALELVVPDGLPARADRGLLIQALDNLLDNALKYCPRGTTVRLSAAGRDDGGVEIAVADDGPGIPADDQPRVFERFYRVEKGRSRDTGGTGLGLAIVKHIAEAHGGRATLESAPGRGTTFRIVLPR